MKIWVVKLQTVLEFSQTRNRGRCSPILTEPFICFQRSWNHKLEIIWATLKTTQDSLPPMKWNKSSGQKISSIALENTKNKISKKREGWERRGGGPQLIQPPIQVGEINISFGQNGLLFIISSNPLSRCFFVRIYLFSKIRYIPCLNSYSNGPFFLSCKSHWFGAPPSDSLDRYLRRSKALAWPPQKEVPIFGVGVIKWDLHSGNLT